MVKNMVKDRLKEKKCRNLIIKKDFLEGVCAAMPIKRAAMPFCRAAMPIKRAAMPMKARSYADEARSYADGQI